MTNSNIMAEKKMRILLVDDNAAIHDDFKQILNAKKMQNTDQEKLSLEQDLFADSDNKQQNKITSNSVVPLYHIDDAYQGEEAIKMVDTAAGEGYPYALIFMDVRMPPGMDGIEAVQTIWRKHPFVEVIICTAHSDYSWEEIMNIFGSTDHLLFIQKPFNNVTIKQIALAMTTKWELDRQNREHIQNLEERIAERTKELQKLVKEKEKYIRNIRDEMALAEIVQQQLLPTQLPELEPVDIAACYIPASKIGGDFYDVIALNDEELAFLIFDVSGHGIAAALVTAIGKFSFRHHLKETPCPQKVLELVNKDICASTPPQMYITAFLLVYNTKNRTAIYSGAGHIPQLHLKSQDNTVQEILAKSLFLGIDHNIVYTKNELQMNKKDKLVFFTDGLTETCNQDDKMYGRTRIKDTLLQCGDSGCQDVINEILKSNEIFKGDRPRLDDLCILAVEIK